MQICFSKLVSMTMQFHPACRDTFTVPRLARAYETGKQGMLTDVQLACDMCKAIVCPVRRRGLRYD